MSEEADDLFVDVRDVMIQMRDGDGSQDAHYAEVDSPVGFDQTPRRGPRPKNMDSAYTKTSGNGCVTNVGRHVINYAKLRG